MSRKFLPYYPSNADDYDYHEPFVGLGSVAYRVINSIPFRTYRLSDSFDWAVRCLQALRGDLTDHGDIIDRLQELRNRLLPEREHEYSIRVAFEDFKDPCRAGDYLGYAYIGNYARKQLVYPQRKDLASFDPTNLGAGISYMTIEKALAWRETLKRASIGQRDAFEVMQSLDGSSFAYIDPPYFRDRDKAWRMYAHEFCDGDHERAPVRLAEGILLVLDPSVIVGMVNLPENGEQHPLPSGKLTSMIVQRIRYMPRQYDRPRCYFLRSGLLSRTDEQRTTLRIEVFLPQ